MKSETCRKGEEYQKTKTEKKGEEKRTKGSL
jgi:hypothetical protein